MGYNNVIGIYFAFSSKETIFLQLKILLVVNIEYKELHLPVSLPWSWSRVILRLFKTSFLKKVGDFKILSWRTTIENNSIFSTNILQLLWLKSPLAKLNLTLNSRVLSYSRVNLKFRDVKKAGKNGNIKILLEKPYWHKKRFGYLIFIQKHFLERLRKTVILKGKGWENDLSKTFLFQFLNLFIAIQTFYFFLFYVHRVLTTIVK